MNIYQVCYYGLSPLSSKVMSADAYKQAELWLKNWTIKGNIPNLLAENEAQAIDKYNSFLYKLVPHWMINMGVEPTHFCFQLAKQSTTRDGFWWDNSYSTNCKRYDVIPFSNFADKE